MLRVIALPEITQLGLSGTEDVAATEPAEAGTSAARPYPWYAEFIERKDREIILWALEKTRFNASSAARILEIPRSTLRSKMEKYSIEPGEPASRGRRPDLVDLPRPPARAPSQHPRSHESRTACDRSGAACRRL